MAAVSCTPSRMGTESPTCNPNRAQLSKASRNSSRHSASDAPTAQAPGHSGTLPNHGGSFSINSNSARAIAASNQACIIRSRCSRPSNLRPVRATSHRLCDFKKDKRQESDLPLQPTAGTPAAVRPLPSPGSPPRLKVNCPFTPSALSHGRVPRPLVGLPPRKRATGRPLASLRRPNPLRRLSAARTLDFAVLDSCPYVLFAQVAVTSQDLLGRLSGAQLLQH